MPAPTVNASQLPFDPVSSSLFAASEDCITVIGLDGALLAINANGARLREIEDGDAWKGRSWASLWPEDHRATIEAAIKDATNGAAARFTASGPTVRGTLKWWDVIICPVTEATELPMRLVAISRDITDRVEIEAEKAMLAGELAHRIRNLFAVVNGVISLSARSAPDEVKPFAEALRERIAALWRATAYVSPLTMTEADNSHDQSLLGLMHVLLEPYGDMPGLSRRVTILGDDVSIGKSATTSVALFANELATNSLKYGALSGPEGRVALASRVDGECLRLVWTETSSHPLPRNFNADEGFGSVLLERAVAQLGGRAIKEWLPAGLRVSIDLAVARLAR